MLDKSIEPKVVKVVIAAINGEMTVKHLSVVDSQMTPTADNVNYPDVKVSDFVESMVWGVVTDFISCEYAKRFTRKVITIEIAANPPSLPDM